MFGSRIKLKLDLLFLYFLLGLINNPAHTPHDPHPKPNPPEIPQPNQPRSSPSVSTCSNYYIPYHIRSDTQENPKYRGHKSFIQR